MDDFSGEINTYGKYLRRLRKSLGLRFEKFRSLLGVSKAYLSDVESGKSKPPSPDMQLKIVDILSVMGNITKRTQMHCWISPQESAMKCLQTYTGC